jgi:hypothetical protein
MQAASQEVQDKLSLLRKLKVRFACLVRDLASIPWAKDRKSVELHGREQTFFFFDNNLQTNRNITASQETPVQGMVLGLLHGIQCKEWSGLHHGCLSGIQCLEHQHNHRSLSHQE